MPLRIRGRSYTRHGGRYTYRRRLARTAARYARKRAGIFRYIALRPSGTAGMDLKSYDTYIGSTTIPLGAAMAGCEMDPSVNCFNCPAQGTAFNQRLGNRIWMKSLMICGEVRWPMQEDAGDPNPDCTVGIWLILDKANNAQNPGYNSEDVLVNQSGNAVQAPSNCMVNLTYSRRYVILRKIMLARPNQDAAYSAADHFHFQGVSVPWKMYVPLRNMITEFATSNPHCGDIVDNAIHLIAVCSNQEATNTWPKIHYAARLRYYG